MSEPVRTLLSPVRLEYRVTAGDPLSTFLRAFMERRILGARCPACRKVYVPLRAGCPTCGVPLEDDPLPIADTGTVTTFCVVNIPFEGQVLAPPYVGASVLLDGADVPFFHLVGGVDPREVRMGLRVRANWVPPEEARPNLDGIRWFEPTSEPDADFSLIARYL